MPPAPAPNRSKWLGRAIPLLICIASGFAINIIVAWTTAAWFVPAMPTGYPDAMQPSEWPIGVSLPPDDPPKRAFVWATHARPYDFWQAAIVQIGPSQADPSAPRTLKWASVVGLPWRSLGVQSDFGSRWPPPLDKSTGFAVTIRGKSISLPTAPLWPGFILNTLLYAALARGAWALCQLPRDLRRRNRRRAGKCVKCGYDRAGIAHDAPCPECGTRPN